METVNSAGAEANIHQHSFSYLCHFSPVLFCTQTSWPLLIFFAHERKANKYIPRLPLRLTSSQRRTDRERGLALRPEVAASRALSC